MIALHTINVVLVVLVVGFTLGDSDDLVLAFLASLGLALYAMMLLGTLYIAVLGGHRVGRWAMRGVLLCWGVFFGLNEHLPEWLNLALLGPCVLGGMWGGALWLLEGAEVRRLGPTLDRAIWDERGGIVQVFHGPSTEEDDEPRHETVEVLPYSRLIYGVEAWVVADITEVADVPSNPRDVWPSPDFAAFQRADAEVVFRERALTENELGELRAFRGKHSWRGLSGVFLSTWVAALLVHALRRLLEWALGAELTAAAWILVGVVLLWRLLAHVRTWRELGQDIERAVVLRVWDRSTQSVADVPLAEFLPASGWGWTEEGRAARWRT